MKRSSGILLHITSLAGPYGIGTLGKEACRFVDFLQAAGQRYWQILPVGPTGFGDSPYQSFCTFAGNPYMIDPAQLAEDGLLEKEELAELVTKDHPERVDYGALAAQRLPVLRKAFARFDRTDAAYVDFQKEAAFWLEEYALFMALKNHFGGVFWGEWPEEIRDHRETAVAVWQKTLAEDVEFYRFLQYEFFLQWKALRRYAHARGVQLIGDVPIYVAMDSSDVWSNPEGFQLDETRRPSCVAGVPPDYFSEDGQLWGNPIYDWDAMEKDGYRWWVQRIRAAASLFDVVRIDHFRGLESYWAVPYGETTARNGVWVKGPGMGLIRTLKRELPELEFIAEDLGFLTPEVIEMVRESGFPGMKILEFAFNNPEEISDYLPHTYERNCVCYTGTHDNETVRQWTEGAEEEILAYAARYLGKAEAETMGRAMIRGGMASVANLFVAQMQDWLELGSEARMNLPGSCDGTNWCWRMEEDALTPTLTDEIHAMTKLYGRL